MDKPSVGDNVTLISAEDSLGDQSFSGKATVLAVFDSLNESWDPWGESAWAQADHDAETGKTGEWYVICEMDEGETVSFASYELK